jgi:uncharacterized protein involved in outer membrane biogenesis
MLKKILKKVSWSLSGVLVISLLIFFFCLGTLTKIIIENTGSDFLGTPVKIKSISIHPLKGTVDLQLLSLQTPDGFKQKNTFTLDSLQLSIDPSSLFSDTIVIHKIRLNNPHFYYEQGKHSDNISETQNQIKKNNSASKKIVIKELLIPQIFIDVTNPEHPEHNIQLTAKDLSFSTKTGKLHLGNISITNPEKIKSPHLFTLDSADLLLDPDSLFSDSTIIQKIAISSPQLFFEKNGTTDTATEYSALIRTLLFPKTANIVDSLAPVQLNTLEIQDFQLYFVHPPSPKQNVHVGFKTLHFSFQSGRLKIDQLALSNPKAIQTPNLFELKSAELQLPKNLLTSTKPFIIQNAHLSQPSLFLEYNFDTGTVPEWRAILQSFTQKTPTTTAVKPNPKPAAKPTTSPLRLQNIQIDDIQLKMLNTAVINPQSQPKTVAKIDHIQGTITNGQLAAQHITIINTLGFQKTNFFELAEIQATFNPASLHQAPFTINEIVLYNPIINLEQTKTQGNIIEWKKSLHQFFPPTKSKAPQQETEKIVAVSSDPVFRLEKLTVTNILVNMTSPLVEPKMLAKFAEKINPTKRLRTDPLPPDSSKTMTLLSVTKCTIEPPKGFVQIKELKLKNPPGFSSAHMLALKETRINFSPKSSNTQTTQIKEILINNPQIRFEQKLSVDNFQVFPEFLMAVLSEPQNTLPYRALLAPPILENPKNGKKIIITHTLIQGGNIYSKISKRASAPIPLPKIVISDIGTKEGDASIQNAFTQIYNRFYDCIKNAIFHTSRK